MGDPTLADAAAAVERIRDAVEVLRELRDVRVQVRVGWQQMGELAPDFAEVLKGRIEHVVKSTLAEQPQAITPGFDVKTECQHTADVGSLMMYTPAIWAGGDG